MLVVDQGLNELEIQALAYLLTGMIVEMVTKQIAPWKEVTYVKSTLVPTVMKIVIKTKNLNIQPFL